MKPIRTCEWIEEGEPCTHSCEGNTNYCGSHNFMLRKLERESLKPVKKPKPIKKVSDKRKDQNNLKEGIKPVPQISNESILSEGQSEPPKKKGTSWPVSPKEKEAEIQAKIELGRKIHELGKLHPGKSLDELKAMVESEKGIV